MIRTPEYELSHAFTKNWPVLVALGSFLPFAAIRPNDRFSNTGVRAASGERQIYLTKKADSAPDWVSTLLFTKETSSHQRQNFVTISTAANTGGNVTLELIKTVGIGFAKQQIKKHAGLDI